VWGVDNSGPSRYGIASRLASRRGPV